MTKQIRLNKYYYLRMSKYCSFEIKIKDIAKNGDFLGVTSYGHCYTFKNKDAINCVPSTEKDWKI